MIGGVVCRVHGGSAPQVRRKAAERLAMAADDAISHMVRVMQDETLEPALRLKAALAIADRTGFVPGMRVEHSVGPTFDEKVAAAAMEEDDQLQRVIARVTGELPAPRELPPGSTEEETVFPEYSDSRVIDGEQVDDHYRYGPGTHPGPPGGPRVQTARIER